MFAQSFERGDSPSLLLGIGRAGAQFMAFPLASIYFAVGGFVSALSFYNVWVSGFRCGLFFSSFLFYNDVEWSQCTRSCLCDEESFVGCMHTHSRLRYV